ncbi:substrate-binding domain-containing protein [Variovorax robiniae]
MATKGLLEELAATHAQRTGVAVSVEAVGGVEAARRVSAGETFDVVALASDAIDKLVATGKLDGSGKVDLVRSNVGVAVRSNAARLDISTDDSLRTAVREASSVAYSTGPSGVALLALFKRWGIEAELQDRLVQAPPGVPVGALVARGDAALGFQQMSELIGIEGIDLLGPLPAESQITTIFSAAPGIGGTQSEAVRAWLDFMTSDESAEAKRRHGMQPA